MISLNLLTSKYLSTKIQMIVSAKSLLLFLLLLLLLLLLTFWLYSLGIPQELPREKLKNCTNIEGPWAKSFVKCDHVNLFFVIWPIFCTIHDEIPHPYIFLTSYYENLVNFFLEVPLIFHGLIFIYDFIMRKKFGDLHPVIFSIIWL